MIFGDISMPPLNTFNKSCLALAITQALVVHAEAAEIIVNIEGDISAEDNNCTLREAITSAVSDPGNITNGCASGEVGVTDIISFDDTMFPPGSESNSITLTSSLPTITSDVTINGQGVGGLTIDGNSTGRVFSIFEASVKLHSLIIRGGYVLGNGGGIYASYSSTVNIFESTISNNTAAARGGGIAVYASSTVNLEKSRILENYVGSAEGGGISVFDMSSANIKECTLSRNYGLNGGALHVSFGSEVHIDRSTLSGNLANLGGAVLLSRSGQVEISNSTISANRALSGGGVYADSLSDVSLVNSTITDNVASYGGGIYTRNASLSLTNNIVSGNSARNSGADLADISADSTISTNTNLLGDSSNTSTEAFLNFTPGRSDVVATSDGEQATPITSILNPLLNNGGGTETHSLVAGSPAIDAGRNSFCRAAPISNLDQRGESRLMGSACDIGSFEFEGELRAEETQIFVIPLPGGGSVVFSL